MPEFFRKIAVVTLIAAGGLGAAVPTNAAILHWDGTDTGANANGGPGVWSPNSSVSNWDTAATDGANSHWVNNSDAVFGGVGGVVSIADGWNLSANSLTFNVSGYTLAGTALGLSGTGTIHVAGSFFATIDSDLREGNLTKTGVGTLILGGNNYRSGTTTLAAGVIELASGNALGSSGTISFTGGTLRFSSANTNDYSGRLSSAAGLQFRFDTNGQTVTFRSAFGGSGSTLEKLGAGTLSFTEQNSYTGTTTITAGTLELVANATTGSGAIVNHAALLLSGYATRTYANTISGTGSLTLNRGGVTTLTGNNTGFSGTVNLTAGKLVLGSANALGDNATGGAITFTGGTLGFTATNTRDYSARFSSATGNAYRFDTGAQTVTFANSFGGAGANGNTLFKTGAGTLVLNAATTHTGGTIVAGGIIRLGDGGSLGAGAVNFASDGTPGTPGLAFANTGALTVANPISGYGTVTQTGSGVTTLAGANTYGGGTTVSSGGTIRVIDGGSLGTGAVVNNGVLKLDNSGAITLANNIGGAGRVVQSGAGTTALNGSNENLTGGVTLESGRLLLGGYNAAGSSGTIVFAGGTLAYGTGNTPDLSARFTGTAGQTFSIDTNGHNITYASAIGGDGNTLVKTGAGTLTLTGVNTYSGTTIVEAGNLVLNSAGGNALTGDIVLTGGTLTLAKDNQIADTATVTLAGGTLDLGGKTDTVGTVIFGGGNYANGSLNATSYAATGGGAVSTLIGGAATFTQSGGDSALTADNTYTGATRVDSGTLSVAILANGGQNSSIGSSSNTAENLVISGGATLAYTGAANAATDRLFTVAGSGSATIANNGAGTVAFTNPGVVAFDAPETPRTVTLAGTNTGDNVFALSLGDNGAAKTAFIKAGVGKWILSATHGYTGTTTVAAGTLVVNGAIAGSATTVNSGATLAGSGTLGALTLDSGAFLSPGAGNGAIGTLFAESLVWNGGGVMSFDLGAAGSGDMLIITGALTKGAVGTYTFNFNGTGVGHEGNTYTLITAGSTDFTAGNFKFTNLGAGLHASFRLIGNSVVVAVGSLSPVQLPEPREYALGLAGAAFVAARLRRRRRA